MPIYINFVPKVSYKLVYQDKKLQSFIRKWNGFTKTLAAYQKRRMAELENNIKEQLQDDERPNRGRYPWRGHVYTGELLSSVVNVVETSSDGTNAYVDAYIGYGAEHGWKIEPPAVVLGNKFVSTTMRTRKEDLDELYNWAYDIVTRRTTGPKLSGAAAVSTAKHWAKNLKKFFESSKDYKGYPIIVSEFEKLMGDGRYFEAICRKVQYGVVNPRG